MAQIKTDTSDMVSTEMRDRTYEVYGDPDPEVFDEYINTNVANRNDPRNSRLAFLKKNKILILSILVATFSSGALLIGLPVGLLAPSCENIGRIKL